MQYLKRFDLYKGIKLDIKNETANILCKLGYHSIENAVNNINSTEDSFQLLVLKK